MSEPKKTMSCDHCQKRDGLFVVYESGKWLCSNCYDAELAKAKEGK